ncbi:hypothetical protein Hanom_Chr11g01064841 [Helianthus anomalus]
MKATRFTLPFHRLHNLRLRSNLEGPAWEDCRFVYNMIMRSPLSFVVSSHVTIYPELLQEFWWNSQTIFGGTSMWIESEVMGVKITLKEETTRNVLKLGDDHEIQLLEKANVQQTLTEMGYHTLNSSRAISKSGFIPPFQFLVTQLSVCFSKKIGHFNELSNRMMEVVHAT